MDLACRNYVPPNGIDQRLDQGSESSVPAWHGRAIQINALARVDLRLPVKRQVIDAFAHDHVCQQSGAGDALGNRPTRHGCLNPTVENLGQLILGRTVRITLKCSGTNSRYSHTSSPMRLSAVPHAGHPPAGACSWVVRGR